MVAAGGTREVLTILESTNPPDGTTRYIDQVVTEASDEVRFTYFTWREALTGRYDVYHVHWPETVMRDDRLVWRQVKRLSYLLLLLRLRVRRVPMVRTLHNLTPHESGSAIERFLLRLGDRRTTLFVHINRTAQPEGVEIEGAQVEVILHGNYVDRFADLPRSELVVGRVLYFGLIRPYKGVLGLINALPDIVAAAPGSTLRVVGSPTPALRTEIEREEREREDLSTCLKFVADEDLVAEVSAAELVVLPYDDMYNSGALIVALSLDRPVLVPRSEVAQSFADEVGPGWVHLFDGPITGGKVAKVLASVRAARPLPRPDLSGRDWGAVAAGYEAAFRKARRYARA